MLKETHPKREYWGPRDNSGGVSQEEFVDLDRLFAAINRQWRMVALFAVLFLFLGAAFLLFAQPLYTASTALLVDRNANKITDELSLLGSAIESEASFLSQVEIIKSEKLGLAVADKLNLPNDPDFSSGSGSWLEPVKFLVKATLGLAPTKADDNPAEAARRDALDVLRASVGVYRIGQSYVIEIAYTSSSAGLSARIADAYADAYLNDQLEAKYDANRRASDWLQSRIDKLREKSLASDLAVQKFSEENGLITAGGALVSDQQLTELNTQLIQTQAETAKAEARYDRLQSIIASGQTDAIVTDALGSSVINLLRGNYMDASKRESEISKALGRDHVQAVRLRNEMGEYKRLMFEELGRIAESYRSELQVAQRREQSLRLSVASASGVSATANKTQVQLRELQREAESYRTLYQNFLQRYQETLQQQTFPVTEARVITRAIAPEIPAFPRKGLVLAIAGLMGVAVGTGFGALREFRDRYFRTGAHVRDQLGLEFLGYVNAVANKRKTPGRKEKLDPRRIFKSDSVGSFVADNPFSSFAETLRSAKIAVDHAIDSSSTKAVGIVSALPGEGKSTISLNFATLLTVQGSRTLLIDADFRNAGLTRAIAGHARTGLLEVLAGKSPLSEVVMRDPDNGLYFLPASLGKRFTNKAEILSSESMAKLLKELEGVFHYVVIDLPPLAPLVDVRTIASKIDAFVLVVGWGRTIRNVVGDALESEPHVLEKCVGAILNRTDPKKLKLYQSMGSSEAQYAAHSAYFREG